MSSQQKYNTLWKRAKRDQQQSVKRSKIEFLEVQTTSNIVGKNTTTNSLENINAQPHDITQNHSESAGAQANSDSDSVDMSDSESVDDVPSLNARLAKWVSDFQVKHNAVDALLKILGEHHPELPRTTRTLLGTCETQTFDVKSGMQYFYFGCKEQITKYLKMYPHSVVSHLDCVDISLNIDGLPLFKSNSQSLWPVLCKLNLSPCSVFPLALCFGVSKPKNLDFLTDTMCDLDDLLQNGLETDKGLLRVNLRCVTCDAPAKALVKCTKQYSGYYGYDKCTQKGFWDGCRVIYPENTNLTLRTNESFRDQIQKEHHQPSGVSPFCMLQMDMVQQFSADYMHQCCLGVMRKLILLWLRGNLRTRLSSGQVREISSRLLQLRPSMPDLFARKPRGLEEIDRWKATELRQFAIYTGKIVLKGILSDDLYEHFLLFSVALSILVCPYLVKDYNSYAADLLVHFVEDGRKFYGDAFLVYNVHSMVHLASDACKYGGLDECSAFPFENYLHQLKRLVRSGRNPLSQIVKRLSEIDKHREEFKTQPKAVVNTQKPNNVYVLSDVQCCEVTSVIGENEDKEKMVHARIYEKLEPFFMHPCDSRLIYKAQVRHTRMKTIPERQLVRKAFLIEAKNGACIVLSMLHSY